MKVAAIIQARMHSERLPGKVLMKIEDKPMLWHVVKRVSSAKLLDEVTIATSINREDDKIYSFAKKNNFKIFRGSEQDCLDRYYQAAKKVKANAIVRITGDCALICPEVIDRIVSEYFKGGFEHVTNTLLYTYPDGCDVEIFSSKVLQKAWKKCKDSTEREHVTPYIRNSGKFKIKNVENEKPIDPREYKWSVDRIEDLEFVRVVYRHLYRKNNIFSMNEVINLLKKHPKIKKINKGTIINEGYYKSIMKAPGIKSRKRQIKISLMLKKKAEKLIPGCNQTFSKGPSQFVQGVAPSFLEKGKGSHVWDVDGNEYIDYAMALGPVILGHNYTVVTKAVKKTLEKGTTFTLPQRLEIELAQLLCEIIPCAEMVRFGKNGSDATSGAVRIARAYTGRDKVACCGYHGWQDWYITTTTRNRGIPKDVGKLTLTFEYNNLDSLKDLFAENKGEIACVIMEPVGIMEPRDNFLQEVKKLVHENGSLLVFDEVITGFRLSLGGAQEYLKVIPDLACFGKAIANGYPISAIVGRRGIMGLFKDIFYSFTFGGEIASIAAAIATIEEMKGKNVIRHLWEQGRKIKDGYNVLAREYGLDKYTQCIGLPPRTIITFKDKKGKDDLYLKSLFQQECLKRGILFTASHNICFSHTDKNIDYTLRVYNTVLEIVKNAIASDRVKKLLASKPIEPVFRKA